MASPTQFDQRPSGIEAVGDLPWGSHFCVLHASPQELVDVVVPFISAGLQCNELCVWEIRAPLTLEDAKRALFAAVPDHASYESRGQIEYVTTPWILEAEALEKRLDHAVLAGFDGLRLTYHAGGGRLGRASAAFTRTLRRHNVITAVSYSRAELGAAEVLQIVQEHRCALICNSGQWEVLEGSEVRSARDALERSEEKLKSLFKSMSEGFAYHRIVLDPQGKPCDYIFLEVSPAFERITGLVAEQILGKRVTQVLPGIEADPTDWIGRYGRVALTGEPERFESYAVALDKWYAISAFSQKKGYFAVTFADISERKRAETLQLAAEERLRVSESRYRSLFQNMTEELHLWKLEYDERANIKTWRLVDANPPALKTWGKTLDEVQGKATDEIFGSGATEHYLPVVQKIMAEGVPHAYEDYFPNLDKYFRFTSIPLGDHFITTGSDITHVQKAISQVEQANVRLEETDQRKNEFLAMLSHELRNPLTPIRNSLYVLDRARPGSEQAKRAREVINRQTSQLARLVDDLLDVTRVSRNKIQLHRSQHDLNDLVHRTVEDHRSSFERRGIDLETIYEAQRLSIDGDEARLTQVIGNLLNNAAKFTPTGGHVTVRTAIVATRGRASVWVIDNGVGVAKAMLPRLFQPFMQGDATLDRSQGGLGLGLALVKGLVELHGGEVCAHSDGPGKGAEFVVELPLDRATATPSGSIASKRGTKGCRVLIIEDNVDAANSLREALELSEHLVEVAYNGPDGLVRARAFKPDVTLCDIGLPEMDGYEVARRFRADDELRNTLLVALSGYALPEDLQLAWEAGFAKHIAKPPNLEQLEELFTDFVHLQPRD